jgi:hypothetical protein
MSDSRGFRLPEDFYMVDRRPFGQQVRETFDLRLWIQLIGMVVSAVIAVGVSMYTQVRRIDLIEERQTTHYNEYKETKGEVTALSSQTNQLSANLAVLTSQMATLNGQLQTIIARDYSTRAPTLTPR